MIQLPELCFVFDVESVGLHGEAFAFGYVVIRGGKVIKEGLHSCPMDATKADSQSSWAWCASNIPFFKDDLASPVFVRNEFWSIWGEWRAKGALMFAECSWPVEASFLNDCVRGFKAREVQAPYPLHDIASIMLARGMDPMRTYDRLPDELPNHNPLCDARQSARLLIEAYNQKIS